MKDRARLYTYYGGKHRLIIEIMKCLPPGEFKVYLELFFGSGATFFALDEERYEKAVINDFDDGVAHLLRMLQTDGIGEEVLECLKHLKVDAIGFLNAKYAEKHYFCEVDDMTKAVMVYQLISQSFDSTRGSFRNDMDQNAYSRQIASGVPLAMEKLRGDVQIENRDATEIIQEYRDEAEAFFFLDPPYVASERKKGARDIYKKEMTDFEHAQMLCSVREIKGKAMICNYDNRLYDELLSGFGWNKYILKEISKPCTNRKDRQSERAVEIIWCNYEIEGREKLPMTK